MKVVLCGLLGYSGGNEYMRAPIQMEHVGIGYLGAALAGQGHEVILQNWYDIEEIKKEGPDVVGLSVMTMYDPLARSIARQVKGINKAVVIVGGSHPSGYPEIVLDPNIDFAVIGEGDRTIVELIEFIKGKRARESLRGVAYQKGGEVYIAPAQPLIEKLDNLSWPMRNEGAILQSRRAPVDYDAGGNLAPKHFQVSGSRGCPFSCSFCTSRLMWRGRVRFRSPEDVVREIISTRDNVGVNYCSFTDLTFNWDEDYVYALCNQLTEQKANMGWYALCSPTFGNEVFYETMKEAGCVRIGWGLESIVSLRKKMGKPRESLEKIRQVLGFASRVGTWNRAFVVIGLDEKPADIEEIKQMLVSLPVDDVKITCLTAFPGTRLWGRFRHILPADFSLYTTQEPIMDGLYLTRSDMVEARQRIASYFFASMQHQQHREQKIKQFPVLEKPFQRQQEMLKESGII